MIANKAACYSLATMTIIGIANSANASLDLLAGVEAGIDTQTSMTSSDLEQTQKILSTEDIGVKHFWTNDDTGTSYEIIIDHHYSYGHYPCLAYDLIITTPYQTETKPLDACKNSNGQWISITSGTTAL
ncbi:MAG TPA: hypothetical protein ENI26_02865 [Methylophaga aminisulfidivorans]|uniref:Uncharacterized protein n=1 Tax=Methylophaga aminisulfidivorans TaxID=230105 RepID=A0A7C1W1U6_9GAMM|nr:hypothetical protein [Methylophaga aminisulfidivorans]HEC73295.1 hypothetical protein [Methylophaga aminisulfidivorans]